MPVTIDSLFRTGSILQWLLLILLLITGCARDTQSLFKAGVVKHTHVGQEVLKRQQYAIAYPGHQDRSIRMKYLGCGGFYIEYEGEALLVDPFFSHIPFMQVPLGKHATRTDWVHQGMEGISPGMSSSIWVTHAHYDHMMDVPYVYQNYLDTASDTVYCPQSGITNMAHIEPRILTQNIDLDLTDQDTTGARYWAGKRKFRVTPIRSDHAPHWWKIRLYSGKAAKANQKYTRATDKTRPGFWKMGVEHSFLIDLMGEEGEIVFRIFVRSSAAQEPDGWLNAELLREHGVDLALLGAASHANTRWGQGKSRYPMDIVPHLQPRHIIICHWEDFFRAYPKNLGEHPYKIRATNIKAYIRKLESVYEWEQDGFERFSMPQPGTWITVNY